MAVRHSNLPVIAFPCSSQCLKNKIYQRVMMTRGGWSLHKLMNFMSHTAARTGVSCSLCVLKSDLSCVVRLNQP